jgi:prepilin-type N-terminal cleavage/methylation domain-containing protein
VKQSHRATAGLTLIELLLVIGIIGILASLLLGAVNKAFVSSQNKIWRVQAPEFPDYIQEHLSKYYQSHATYAFLSADDLYRQGTFDDRIINFLRCPHVQYFPFSMSDGTNKVIFQLDADWLNQRKSTPGHTNYIVLLKMNVAKK